MCIAVIDFDNEEDDEINVDNIYNETIDTSSS